MWLKQNRRKLAIAVAVLLVLAAAFWYGGDAPDSHGWRAGPPAPPVQAAAADSGLTPPPAPTPLPEATSAPMCAPEAAPSPEVTPTPEATPEPEATPTPEATPEPTPEATNAAPEPSEAADPPESEITDPACTCTLTVRCDTLLLHLEQLPEGTAALVPADGVIFAGKTVTFYEGESVFNVLERELKLAGIHLEFVSTPLYNACYVEGLANLYEFDCGEQSGWMYRVNGWFPNYSASRYLLHEGDCIEWLYTCDRGVDISGGYLEAQQ